MLPSTAPIVEISLGGHAQKLYFGFRAWQLLDVQPMNVEEVQGFLTRMFADTELVAKWIWAGLTAYRKLVQRLAELDGEPPPVMHEWTEDEVLDVLDISTFSALLEAMKRTSPEGEKGPEADAIADPQ